MSVSQGPCFLRCCVLNPSPKRSAVSLGIPQRQAPGGGTTGRSRGAHCLLPLAASLASPGSHPDSAVHYSYVTWPPLLLTPTDRGIFRNCFSFWLDREPHQHHQHPHQHTQHPSHRRGAAPAPRARSPGRDWWAEWEAGDRALAARGPGARWLSVWTPGRLLGWVEAQGGKAEQLRKALVVGALGGGGTGSCSMASNGPLTEPGTRSASQGTERV